MWINWSVFSNSLHFITPGKLQAAKDVCIFISHSGNSGETIAAANHVIAKGVTTLAVTQHSGTLIDITHRWPLVLGLQDKLGSIKYKYNTQYWN